MKTIMVASDLTARSERAVARALQIAERGAARVEVVTVIDEDLPPNVADGHRMAAEAALATHLDRHAGADVESVVIKGRPVDALLAHERSLAPDLLVLGVHRPRSVLDGLRETTMERLVRLGIAPVLLVKSEAGTGYGRILAGTSFSPACAEAIAAARAVAPDAALAVVHAHHVPFAGIERDDGGALAHAVMRETEAAAAAWRATLPNDVPDVEIVEGDVGEVLSARIEDGQILAIGAHTRVGLTGPTLGGFTAELVRDPPADLLIARARRGG